MTRSIALAFSLLAAALCQADTISFTRNNTGDIRIPRFDPAMGTLTGVELRLTLLGGQTTTAPAHTHAQRTVLSSNTVGTSQVTGFTPITLNSVPAPSHPHTYTTPAYSGGGVSLGTFSGATSSNGAHGHQVQATFDGVQPAGSGEWRVRARLMPSPAGQHGHGYAGDLNIYSFAGPAVNPFLGVLDLVIPASPFSTDVTPATPHQVPAFTRELDGFFVFDDASFPPSSLLPAGAHSHTINPRFNTFVQFTFTPIPEPATGMIALIAMAGLADRRRSA